MKKQMKKPMEYAFAAALAVLVAGCGGGGGGGDGGGGGGGTTPPPAGGTPPAATQFTLGGTVSGLGQGANVTIANGSDRVTVGNGSFSLPTKLAAGAAYNVTATPPGGYTCKVTDGSGAMGSADSTKTAVACAPVVLAGVVTALQEPQGVASDSAGNLYVVDGGPHAIMKITPAGGVSVFAGDTGKPGFADGPAANARFRFYGGGDVLVDQQGNLFVSDECNGAIRKVTPDGTVSTLAGQGSAFCNNVLPAGGLPAIADGTGRDARFERPNRMVSDGAGGVIVLDSVKRGTIRMVSATGAVTTGTYAAPSGSTTVPIFYAIARANDGTLYLSDLESRIWKDVGGTLTPVAEHLLGTAGQFTAITDMVAASNGDLYVADSSTVRKINAAGDVMAVAGSSTRGFADGQGTAARFTSIRAMGLAGNDLIVIDNDQGALRRVTPDGTVTTLAATPAQRGSTDAAGAAARYNWANSIAAGTDGSVYHVDSITHTIRKTAPDGTVTTLAGKAGTAGDAEGAFGTATFNSPRAIAVGRDGSMWVAQASGLRRIANNTVSARLQPLLAATNVAVEANGNAIVTTNGAVLRVTPAGAATTLVDTAKIRALINNATANFIPQSAAVDAAGNVYVSDTGTVAVYKVTPAGEVTVFAGTPLKEGDADGPVNTATLGFYEVEFMTIDDKGNLYLSGQGGVRMISPAGVVSTPNFVWGKASIGGVAFANGKLYGMTRYALLQHYLP
ncbi:MAG: hypothetical protein V7631_3291 [Massilia sp.]|jgi:hypothetical protein